MNRLTSDRSQLAQFLFRGAEACYCMVPFIDKRVGKRRTVVGQPLLDFEKGVQLKANEMWLPFCTRVLF
jgi:hypothetical protein